MRRFLTITTFIAAITLSAGIAGCNNDNTDDKVTAESTLSGEETDALFNIGEVKDNVYTNDFFNIKFTCNEDWRLLNEEQLATISSSIKDVLTNEEAKQALDEGKTSIIMYGVSNDKNKNASITVEKHSINNTQDADMDAFLDKSVKSLSESLPGQGFTDLEVSKTDITFCGEPAKGIKIKAKYKVKSGEEGQEEKERDVYESMIYIFRGSYSGCVTASSFDEDKTSDVLEMFSKLQ